MAFDGVTASHSDRNRLNGRARNLGSDARLAAQKTLGVILSGHAIEEKWGIYPALALIGGQAPATTAYTEQATVNIQIGTLETIPPMSQRYLDKLDHIREAVLHHRYEEEGSWFIQLRNRLTGADQAKLTDRYEDEFDLYLSEDMGSNDQRGARPCKSFAARHYSPSPLTLSVLGADEPMSRATLLLAAMWVAIPFASRCAPRVCCYDRDCHFNHYWGDHEDRAYRYFSLA